MPVYQTFPPTTSTTTAAVANCRSQYNHDINTYTTPLLNALPRHHHRVITICPEFIFRVTVYFAIVVLSYFLATISRVLTHMHTGKSSGHAFWCFFRTHREESKSHELLGHFTLKWERDEWLVDNCQVEPCPICNGCIEPDSYLDDIRLEVQLYQRWAYGKLADQYVKDLASGIVRRLRPSDYDR